MEHVKQFIAKFPKYESHYGRAESSKMFLSPNLNLNKIFKEYKIVCEFQNRTAVSESTFRTVFNYEFNLSFKTLKKDTCNTCDKLETQMKDCKTLEKKQQIEMEKSQHFSTVSNVKNQFRSDICVNDEKKNNMSHIRLTKDASNTGTHNKRCVLQAIFVDI